MPVLAGKDWVEKRLSPRERTEPEAVARLLREVQLLRLLEPLGVTPRVIADGQDASGPWHRLERLALPTLAQRAALGPDPAWVERRAPAAFEALARIHEAADAAGPLAIVHADPSPANIAADDARVVILDLDLAWWREGHPPLDGAFRGTLGTVAPEVARGERPTVSSDLFALAASWLELSLGRPLRQGASLAALVVQAAEEPILDAETCARVCLRGATHRVLVTCLASTPEARPGSARSVCSSMSLC